MLVSDCFSAYDKDRLDEWLKQKCFAHLLKDLTAMKETARAAAAAFKSLDFSEPRTSGLSC